MIAIVLRLVLDHLFLEDHPQLLPELHTVGVLEVLNDAIIVLPQVQVRQTGGADHPLLLHEIPEDLPKGPLEPLLDVRLLQFTPKEHILHKPPHEILGLVLLLVGTVHPVLSQRTEIETLPDQRHENGLLYDL